MARTALITGITGQDGAYLAQYLLDKNYQVHGLVRRECVDTTERLTDILNDITLHDGDLTDGASLYHLFKHVQPDEVYNLGAQSHVATSFKAPQATLDINGGGALRLLEAVRLFEKPVRFYQASSSEMFGNIPAPQNEETPMHPCNPYGCAKLYAYHLVKTYREAYGLHASNGILFNHESPLRGGDFVTQKVADGVAAIAAGGAQPLVLGNLDARRDWGHARDYVEGMWLMLQQDTPDDYVLATGETYSVREFVEEAFTVIGRTIAWEGAGLDEKGIDAKTGDVLVRLDEQFFRPLELNALCGDASKAKKKLGWAPKISFEELVSEMVIEAQKKHV